MTGDKQPIDDIPSTIVLVLSLTVEREVGFDERKGDSFGLKSVSFVGTDRPVCFSECPMSQRSSFCGTEDQ